MFTSLRLLGLSFLVAGYLTLTGCEPESKTPTNPPGGDGHDHGHGHDHVLGPHGGDIILLAGSDYHAELVHKKKSSLVAIYLLDADMKDAVPIEAEEITLNLTVEGNPVQYTLSAAPLDGEPEGQSSRFELAEVILADLLSSDDEITGRLNVTIAGTDYVGDFEHHGHDHAHDHGDHDHGDDDHEGHDHADEGHDHADEGEDDRS